MFVKRELIKSVRMLASRLFKVHRKAGAARRSSSDCVTEFHPTIDGTLLVVRYGDHSLSRIITSERFVRPFACSHQWLKHLVYVWQPLAGVQSPPDAPETLQINTTDYKVA